MKKQYYIKLTLLAVIICSMMLPSCSFFQGKISGISGGPEGEVIGVQGRRWTGMQLPYGMVVVPAGTFIMGNGDQDIASSYNAMNRRVTISSFYMDDSEITNNKYRQFIYVLEERQEGPQAVNIPNNEFYTDFIAEFEREGLEKYSTDKETFIREKLYPDTTVWARDFTHHLGDPMLRYYFSSPAFDDYPVVGVSWEAAKFFAKWRTGYLNSYRIAKGEWQLPDFRLPSETEWEFAAKGGRILGKYPWGGPYLKNALGCVLANFKPGRGNYYDDGHEYTSPVKAFFPNDYGLYGMAGNVSEWCEDAFHRTAAIVTWDLNPTYFDENEPRKVIKGGSWKDIAFFLETGSRSFEHKDTARSYIGFRCAMSYLGQD